MKKGIILLVVLMLISIGFLSGCTNQQSATIQKEKIPYVILGSGYEGSQYVYVDVQNIGNTSGEFVTDFSFTYVDNEAVGSGTDRGGRTNDWYPGMPLEGTMQDSRLITSMIVPHETKRVECPIDIPTGYFLGYWNYEIKAL